MEFNELPNELKLLYYSEYGKPLNTLDKNCIEHRARCYKNLNPNIDRSMQGYTDVCKYLIGKYNEKYEGVAATETLKTYVKIGINSAKLGLQGLIQLDISKAINKRGLYWADKFEANQTRTSNRAWSGRLTPGDNKNIFISIDLSNAWYYWLKSNGIIEDLDKQSYLESKIPNDNFKSLIDFCDCSEIIVDTGKRYNVASYVFGEFLKDFGNDYQIKYHKGYLLIKISSEQLEECGNIVNKICDAHVRDLLESGNLNIDRIEDYKDELKLGCNISELIYSIQNKLNDLKLSELFETISVIHPVVFKGDREKYSSVLIDRPFGNGNRFELDIDCESHLDFQYMQSIFGFELELADMITLIDGTMFMAAELPEINDILSQFVISLAEY